MDINLLQLLVFSKGLTELNSFTTFRYFYNIHLATNNQKLNLLATKTATKYNKNIIKLLKINNLIQ